MTLVQILIIGFIILVLTKTFSELKKKKIRFLSFFLWTGIWTTILIVALDPKITNFLAGLLGVKRGIDVVIYFSILFIFFVLFKIIAKLEKIDQEITKIVREISFRKKNNKTNYE